MSTDRQHDQIVISCDSCEIFFEAGAEGLNGDAATDWSVVWPMREGWKARKIGQGKNGEWLHFCPECRP